VNKRLYRTLAEHSTWLSTRGKKGKCADLSGAGLVGVDLSNKRLRSAVLAGADLRKANLRCADLREADLRNADLREASVQRACLQEATLIEANLHQAVLSGASLRGAMLHDANLSGALLAGVDMQLAQLDGANLLGAYLPAPQMMLLANWGNVSPDLCIQLMRYVVANRPGSSACGVESAGYPDDALMRTDRCAHFVEEVEIYSPGPALSAFELMRMCIRKYCADSDYHTHSMEG